MKVKILSIIIFFSFSACVLSAPLHAFVRDFLLADKAFQSQEAAPFSKGFLFKMPASKLGGFTKNIKAPDIKTDAFLGDYAISSPLKHRLVLEESPNNSFFTKTIANSNIFNLTLLDRLRMCGHTNASAFFVFFILLYVGMLRAVYLNKIFTICIKKPLFA